MREVRFYAITFQSSELKAHNYYTAVRMYHW